MALSTEQKTWLYALTDGAVPLASDASENQDLAAPFPYPSDYPEERRSVATVLDRAMLQAERARVLELRLQEKTVAMRMALAAIDAVKADLAYFRMLSVQTKEGAMQLITSRPEEAFGFMRDQPLGLLIDAASMQAARDDPAVNTHSVHTLSESGIHHRVEERPATADELAANVLMRATNGWSAVTRVVSQLKSRTFTAAGDTADQWPISCKNGVFERDPDVPLVHDRELEVELFTPLRRLLLIPEELIPDAYSEVQRANGEIARLYLERLTQDDPDHQRLDFICDNLTTVLRGATSAVGAMPISLGFADPGVGPTGVGGGHDAYTAKMWISQLAVIGVALVELYRGYKKRDVAGMACAVVDGVIGGLVLGVTHSWDTADFGKARSMTYSGEFAKLAIRACDILLTEDDPEVMFGRFVEELGGLVDTVYRNNAAYGDYGERRQAAFTGGMFRVAFRAAGQAIQHRALTQIRNRDWTALSATLATLAETACADALLIAGQKWVDEALQQARDDWNVENGLTVDASLTPAQWELRDQVVRGRIGTASHPGPLFWGEMVELGAEDLSKNAEGLKSEILAAEALQTPAEEFDKPGRDLVDGLHTALVNLDEAERTQTDFDQQRIVAEDYIKGLRAELKKSRVIFGGLAGFLKIGASVSGALVPGASVSMSALLLLEEGLKAAKRLQALNHWAEVNSYSERTANQYGAALRAEMYQLRRQYIHHGFKAFFASIQVVGRALQLSGIVSIAGVALEASASVAYTAEELVYRFQTERLIKKAWKVTKQALRSPGDRKTNLLARRENPSLAKYALAYGAVVERDAVAEEIFRKLDIHRDNLVSVLSERDKLVHAIVGYLEELYEEDIQIYKSFPGDDAWLQKTPPPELTPLCWYATYGMARTLDPNDGLTPKPVAPSTQRYADEVGKWLDRYVDRRRDVEEIERLVEAGTEAEDLPDDFPDEEDVEAAFKAVRYALSKLSRRLARFHENCVAAESSEPHLGMLCVVETLDEEVEVAAELTAAGRERVLEAWRARMAEGA